MTKIKNEGKNHIFNGSKTTFFESVPEREPFYKIIDVSKNKYRRFTKLNKLVSLESQVKAVRLKEKLGEQTYYQNIKKVFEPYTDTIESTSEILTKTFTENSINN